MSIDITTIEGVRDQLEEWLGHGKRFMSDKQRKYTIEIIGPGYGEPGVKTALTEPEVVLRIWTRDNVYHIRAHPHKFTESNGYLGCGVSLRATRPGEDHTRGNDLADGPFTEAIWAAIMLDIVSYEAQEVVTSTAAIPV